MYGVLVEVTPSGCKNMEAVEFAEHRGRYGKYEVIRDYPADQVLREFERDNRRRYERRSPFMDFSPNNPDIEKVIFNDPATIVIWKDGTKTVVKCQPGDTYDKELGLALCISKKYLGNKGNFNEVFKKWIPEGEKKETITVYDNNGNVVKEFTKEGISVAEMRNALYEYCDTRTSCEGCKLTGRTVCRCGWGTHFKTKNGDGSYDMSDKEIRDAYKKLFG